MIAVNTNDIIDLMATGHSWEQVIYKIIAWEGLDPWDLDIKELSDSFVKYIEKLKELDFKIPAHANSGVIIRCPDQGRPSASGIEIQIAGTRGLRRSNRKISANGTTGAVFGVVAPNADVQRGPDEWNTLQVRCDGTPARLELCQQKLGLAPDVTMTPPLHPSMLYEAVLEGLVLFIILWWFSSKKRPYMAISGVFLLFYGVFRFVVEFYRVPDVHLGYLVSDWVTMGQVLSAPMIVAGAVLLYLAYRYDKKTEAMA